MGKKDYYALSLVPEKVKAAVLSLPESERKEFSELTNENPSHFLMNTFHMDTDRFDTQAIRNEINKMSGKHCSYYTIKVKLLYDNEKYKDEFRRALEATVTEYGRRFDFITSDSIRQSVMFENDGEMSDYIWTP